VTPWKIKTLPILGAFALMLVSVVVAMISLKQLCPERESVGLLYDDDGASADF